MGEPALPLGPFPPLSSTVAASSPTGSRGLEEGELRESPPAGRGAWRDLLGKRPHVGKLRYYPNVLQNGIVSPPMELLQAGARAWSHALVGFFWSKRVAFPVDGLVPEVKSSNERVMLLRHHLRAAPFMP
ncbi:hypothetical protein K2173_024055 [Erythroxylum novogranatense]|uniref:Uncharacterized protein n=1 Tax=Erythroxylum novogranatense TaxID=1862640 RepID=A0AAV8TSJ9_9ROSI|nr:hypothetical protein K2173_024055 [Erythroxylum novogranatense]